MIQPFLRPPTRNAEAPSLFEGFFVAAVASFLGIRWFLGITGYPQIGSHGVHIAHMLWGGLLMLFAVLLLLAFIGRKVQHVAAVVAGLGFGTFIDEIGKFVTADNDYFYRPAVALVYLAFVAAFLVARTFLGRRRLSSRESLANALQLLAGAPDGPIRPDDRARIAQVLARADSASPETELVRRYLAGLPSMAANSSLLVRMRRRGAESYDLVMASPWAERALTFGVVAYAGLAFIGVALLVSSGSGSASANAGLVTTAQVSSTVVGALLVGRGVLSLPSSRIVAYRWFMRGILVWILVTQVFVFYSSQLAGLSGLAADLLAYASLRFAILREISAGRGQPL